MITLPEELVGLPYVEDPATGIVSLLAAVPVERMAPLMQVTNQGRVRHYATAMTEGAHFPPVDLFGPRWPGDSYELFNGHHRREAAIRAGIPRLLAWVTPVHRRPDDPPAWWASVLRREIGEDQLGPQWKESRDETPSSFVHERALYDLLLRHARSPEAIPWDVVLREVLRVALDEGGLHPGWAEEMVWAGLPIPGHLMVGLRSRAQGAVLRPGFAFRASVGEDGRLVWIAPTGDVWSPAVSGRKQRGRRWRVVGRPATRLDEEGAHGVRTTVLTP